MRMGATVEECELPSFYELLDRFSLFDSSASSGCDVQIGKNGSLFCKCEGCIRWSDFVEGRDPSDIEVKYEVFTREHVAGLACYLRTRAAEFELSVMDVLEARLKNEFGVWSHAGRSRQRPSLLPSQQISIPTFHKEPGSCSESGSNG